MNLILNFLPMIILYLIATYSPQVAHISHTVLGKVIAIGLILLYTFFDIISGLLVCALVIFYYQTDYVESFATTIVKDEVLIIGSIDLPAEDPVDGHKEVLSTNEVGEELEDAYPLEPTIIVKDDKAASDFRQKHCAKGSLMNKGQVVKPEMAEHVFPEIKQDDFHKCNICDPSCGFEIVDNQMSNRLMKAEENLIKPKSSNDFFEVVWKNIEIRQSG
jgi:hypothetical protein